MYIYDSVALNSSSSSSSIGTATLVGFGLLNYRWVFSAGRFLQSPVASGTSYPQQGVPTPETTGANPTSGRWHYGPEIAENFAENGDFHVTFGFFYMPYTNDMGPTALLPFRRKAYWGIFCPKNPTASAGTRGQNVYL